MCGVLEGSALLSRGSFSGKTKSTCSHRLGLRVPNRNLEGDVPVLYGMGLSRGGHGDSQRQGP